MRTTKPTTTKAVPVVGMSIAPPLPLLGAVTLSEAVAPAALSPAGPVERALTAMSLA